MLEPTHWWTEQLHAFTHSALLLILPLCLLVSHTVLVLCDIKHRGWIWKPSCLHIMPAKIVQLCRGGGGYMGKHPHMDYGGGFHSHVQGTYNHWFKTQRQSLHNTTNPT